MKTDFHQIRDRVSGPRVLAAFWEAAMAGKNQVWHGVWEGLHAKYSNRD